MNSQIFVYSFIGLLVYLFIATHAGAACVPVYGGGPTCTGNTSLSIQKAVLNPSTNTYVHNLGMADPKFQLGNNVTFQVTLTNTGTATIAQTIVKDHLPSLLTFVSGPGQFDINTHMLTFEADNLVPNKPQSFTITTRVASTNSPQQCPINTISALPSTGVVTQDSSQFCLANITSTPSTGAETWALVALLPLVGIGFGLKHLS